MAESVFQTGSAEKVLALVSQGLLKIDFEMEPNRPRLERFAKRYADRAPDLANLCLICLSERLPKIPVLTVDSDFLVYPRHQREAIPVQMPGS